VFPFRRLPQGVSAVCGGLLVSQFPAFFDQYLQSLGGRLDQARIHAARVIETARDQGLTLEAYIQRFAENIDPVVRTQAELMSSALVDEARLEAAYNVLTQASAGARPFLLLRHIDADIAAATADRFTPAAPLGLEGLLYAAVGALLGLAALAEAVARMSDQALPPGQRVKRITPGGSSHAG